MNTIEFPDRSRVTEQAAAWIAVIDRGISNDEQIELDKWLSQSSLHGEMLVHTASMWDLLDVLSPIAKLLPISQLESLDFSVTKDNDKPLMVARTPDAKAGLPLGSLSIAASVLALAIGLLLFTDFLVVDMDDPSSSLTKISRASSTQSASVRQPLEHTYATSVGEQSTINLSDGSEIKLNTDSELTVYFSQDERRIALKRGEAYFDVSKNPDRPFVVITKSSRVTAVGTAFSIDVSHAVDTEVLVAEGRVKVDRYGTRSDREKLVRKTANPSVEEPVFLSQGQKVLLNDDAVTLSASDDVEDQLAWRNGRIVFTGETLAQVVKEINRYTPIEFRIIDPAIASISVGGFFKTGDMRQLIAVLEQNFGVRSERQQDIVFLSRAR
ncbi:MAG: transmembrane sensor [Arenicella sp.]|jgi:transmembrane sensor